MRAVLVISDSDVMCVILVLRLMSHYEESRGSYVAQLEIYSLYLLASTKAGAFCPLSNTDFNALLR